MKGARAMLLFPKKAFILSIKLLSYLHIILIPSLSTASVGPGLIDTLWNKVPLMTSDPKLLIETLWTQYNSKDGRPINIYVPGLKNIYFIYHPKDIADLRALENKDLIKKGFTVHYIKKYLLGEAFATQETGEMYHKLHKLFMPHFQSKHISSFDQDILGQSLEFFEFLKKESEDDKTLDIQEYIKSFSMSVISKTMLNYDLRFDDGLSLYQTIKKITEFVFYHQVYSPFVFPLWVPTAFNKRYKEAFDQILILCDKIIENDKQLERQAIGDDTLIRSLRLSIEDPVLLKDQIINIFFGGHETTAHWITMALYHLESKPEVKQNIQSELSSIDCTNPSQLTLKTAPFLTSFIKEVLRLNAPIDMYGRDATQDIYLRQQKIPKGSLIISTQYAAHRYELSWTKPLVFDPNRFHPKFKHLYQKEAKQHIRAYFPFGFGSRGCIGRFFSEIEIKTFLVAYLRHTNMSFELVNNKEPETEIICTSRLKKGLLAKIIEKQ